MFYLHEISQTISHNKLRTALTGLAVSWGIFMLIVLVGMSNGLVRKFENQASATTSNNITYWGGFTTKAYKGYSEGRPVQLKHDDAEAIAERSQGRVAESYTSVSNDTATISTATEFATGGYQGVSPGAEPAERIKMVKGRFINDLDMSQQRKVIVLSSRTVDRLFPDGTDPVGKFVTCMGLNFKVVGVYEHRWRDGSYIPYTTARVLAGNSDDVGSITTRLQGVTTVEEGEAVEHAAIETLASRHGFDADDTGAIWARNQFTSNEQISSNMSVLGTITWVIGVLTLLSGIIGVSNIMFVSVRERTHEIGVRRAIGARPRQILNQIILESVAITAMFGYIGILLGIGLLQLLTALFGGMEEFPKPVVDIQIAVEVTVLLVIAGALAGLFPALKALKVKPVEALRDE